MRSGGGANALHLASRDQPWDRANFAVAVDTSTKHRQRWFLPPELHETDSRDFFQWLALQHDRARWEHLAEIGRHWRERREGPLRWWRHHQDIACLPVIAGGELLLVSYKQAIERPVYLPDFPNINQQFAEREARSGVVHEGILREFADLRRDGIRSLREFLVGRGEITTVNPGGHGEQRQQEAIRYVQIAASGRRLIAELSRVGVSQSRLKLDFLSMMAQLSTVRTAEKIIVRYRVGATVYETDTKAGLDDSYTLWVTDDASDIAPFEALAERLFRPGEDTDTAPYKLFKAVQAVRASYGRLVVAPPPARDDAVESSEANSVSKKHNNAIINR